LINRASGGERHATPGGMHAQMTLDGQRIMMGQGSGAASGCQVRTSLAGGGDRIRALDPSGNEPADCPSALALWDVVIR
jgi:hypothetical protein